MVALPEELKHLKEKKNPLPSFNLIYAKLGFYFTVGTIMSFNILGLKRVSAALMAVMSVITAGMEMSNTYRQVVLARILFRNFACAGAYIMVAGGLGKGKYKAELSQRLLKLGRQIIGAYLVLLALLLLNNKKEFALHAYLLPGGAYCAWVLIIFYFVCGIAMDYGLAVVDVCKAVMIVLFIVTLTVDVDTGIWNIHGKIKPWKAYTIAGYHIPVISTLMLMRPDYF